MMDLRETLRYQNQYIRDNNYTKTCGINLYCCELNFYRNGIYYLQQFICRLYTVNNS